MNTQKLAQYIKAGYRVLLAGPPGIAKTATLLESAKLAEYHPIVVTASLMERVDIAGAIAPAPDGQTARMLPLQWLADLRTTSIPTMLLIDEIGSAPIDVQAGIISLLEPGNLPACVTVCGATNRPSDKAGVLSLCEPLRSRFHIRAEKLGPHEAPTTGNSYQIPWKTSLEGWLEYGESKEFPPELLAFHSLTGGKFLYAWSPNPNPGESSPDFRTWETAAKFQRDFPADSKDIMPAIVGKTAASAYQLFRKSIPKCPPLSQILGSPHDCHIPSDPEPLAITRQILLRFAGKAGTTAQDLDRLATYADRLGKEPSALIRRAIVRKSPGAIVDWQLENSDMLEAVAL